MPAQTEASKERAKSYDPQSVEGPIYERWLASGVGRARTDSTREPYVILMPPPNVTGVLHAGHILNNTIQDALIRWQRMSGKDALWLPGMDHAGIATQNVVERTLAKQGVHRRDLGREKFVEEVWKWKEHSGGIIFQQLQRLGCLPDWDRFRFTLDPEFVRAVLSVFVRLYNKGLIYRGEYITNWCPKCQTAISDEEVEHVEVKGKLHFLRYPMPDHGRVIVVATTRPETMLGDVAVAVNPRDPRYAGLDGARVILPLVNREMRVVVDDMVDMSFGTGAVKITPAHDPNDFQLAQRHNLSPIEALDAGAHVSLAGPYEGMERFEARKAILRDLEAQGLIERVEDYETSIGHHDRCGTMIEPRLSLQWFVRMKPLAEPALDAWRRGEVRFYPEHWAKIYEHWMTNIRDWCISRQLWWGHRIPVYTCGACGEVVASVDPPAACARCGGATLTQDPDVLDTWFSSWLWPFATLGWPEETPDLARYFPSNVLVTAPEILFFWVARMIMASWEFRGATPFRDVYLHGIVRDGKGRKMSKSLGNSPDPIDLIDRYGADALRFTMMMLTPQGSDVLFDESKTEIGKHFANKIWNATRLVASALDGWRPPAAPPKGERLDLPARWILGRLAFTTDTVSQRLASFEMLEAARTLYDFVWHDFCDWYLEMAKRRVASDAPAQVRDVTRWTLWRVLSDALALLHPFMPFLTDELWRTLPRQTGDPDSIVIAPWPTPPAEWRAAADSPEMNTFMEVVRVLRTIRAEMNLPPAQRAPAVLRAQEYAESVLDTLREDICVLARLSTLSIGSNLTRPSHAAAALADGVEVFVPLEGLLDLAVERRRLEKEVARATHELEFVRSKLANADFLAKARPEVVEREREKLHSMEAALQKLEGYLAAVSGRE
jgi:valyl-tRNA synthetase